MELARIDNNEEILLRVTSIIVVDRKTKELYVIRNLKKAKLLDRHEIFPKIIARNIKSET